MGTKTSEFWADRVNRLKKEGKNDEVLKICHPNIPLPAAFREIGIALRKLIRERRKEKHDYEDLLQDLYQNAVYENFFETTSWHQVLDMGSACSMAGSILPDIDCSYDTIGYKNLEALKATDIKWMLEKWGEPSQHTSAKNQNLAAWSKAKDEFTTTSKQQWKAIYKSAGLPQEPIDLSKGRWPKTKTGCFSSFFVVTVFVIFYLILLAWQ